MTYEHETKLKNAAVKVALAALAAAAKEPTNGYASTTRVWIDAAAYALKFYGTIGATK